MYSNISINAPERRHLLYNVIAIFQYIQHISVVPSKYLFIQRQQYKTLEYLVKYINNKDIILTSFWKLTLNISYTLSQCYMKLQYEIWFSDKKKGCCANQLLMENENALQRVSEMIILIQSNTYMFSPFWLKEKLVPV